MVRWIALSVALLSFGCSSNKCAEAPVLPTACAANTVPVGSWTGEWQSHPLAHPDFVRSGNLDLVVAADGKMSGQLSEHDNPDTGSIRGSVAPGGQFVGDALVLRGGAEKRYKITGTFVCEKTGPAGAGEVVWGSTERGNLKFRLQSAP